jgi:prevent-host-death family protein
MLCMYNPYMAAADQMNVSEARERLAEVIDRARSEHRPVYLTRRGRRIAAVVDPDDLDRLIELAEDMADIRAAEEARAEMRATGVAPIPWEQVKAELGLT